MKRVINGKTYNTDTATVVARWEYVDIDEYETTARLFQTKGGTFFVVNQWQTPESWKTYFEVMTREQMKCLVEEADNLEILDPKAVREPPEAA